MGEVVAADRQAVRVAFVSGKGGVGKTSVAIGTAYALAKKGHKVGMVDLDLESSSLGDVLSLTHDKLQLTEGIEPVMVDGVKVVSLSLFPDKDWYDVPTLIDEERVFRIVGQLFQAVRWGELDVLCTDFPPGCGPEIRALIKQGVDGLVLVTAAQRMSELPVRRLVRMAREEYHLPIIGVVNNDPYHYSGKGWTGEVIAKAYNLPLLATIPWDPAVADAMDAHRPPPAQHYESIATAIAEMFADRLEAVKG